MATWLLVSAGMLKVAGSQKLRAPLLDRTANKTSATSKPPGKTQTKSPDVTAPDSPVGNDVDSLSQQLPGPYHTFFLQLVSPHSSYRAGRPVLMNLHTASAKTSQLGVFSSLGRSEGQNLHEESHRSEEVCLQGSTALLYP